MFTENVFDQTLNLYKDSKSKSITLNCIRSFLSNEEYQKSFIAHINKLLSTTSTRLDGLQLATECIEKISPNVLSEHASFWVKCCLTNYENSQNKEIYLKTLKNIIECSQKHSEFSRKFALEFLSPILDIALNSKTDLYIKSASLECINSSLKCYSSFCKQQKRKIEDYLLHFLESSSEALVTNSGLAFFFCQKIPTIGNNVNTSINNCTLSLRRLCVTCHQCLDSIFEHHLEIERFEVEDIEPFKTSDPPLSDNSYLRLQYRSQIIKNCLEWLAIFFKEGTGIIEYPQEILTLLQRGLSLHICSKQKSVESEYLYFNLMEIQTKILHVLSLLILSMKGRIAPFYPFISEILRNIFNKNKSCNCYNNCSVFQEYFYETLLELLSIGHGLDKPLQNALVSQIIEKNTPAEEGVRLKVHNLKGKSSKLKQNTILNSIASRNNDPEIISSTSTDQLETNITSLEGLLILMNDSTLDNDNLEKIVSFSTENIMLLQNGNLKAPFNNRQCQELLYEILCSVFEHDNSTIFETYGEIINRIFITGCTDENLNIASTCLTGLRNMEKVFFSLQYSSNGNGNIVKNNIRIIENNLLVPAAKMEVHTEEYMEEQSHLTEESEPTLELEEKNITTEENRPQKKELLIEENSIISAKVEEENMDIKNDIEGNNDNCNVEENFVIKNDSQESNAECNDEDNQIEPVMKKRKVEEDVENLFVDEFDDVYK